LIYLCLRRTYAMLIRGFAAAYVKQRGHQPPIFD